MRNKDSWEFRHPTFIRGREDLLASIRRKQPQTRKASGAGASEVAKQDTPVRESPSMQDVEPTPTQTGTDRPQERPFAGKAPDAAPSTGRTFPSFKKRSDSPMLELREDLKVFEKELELLNRANSYFPLDKETVDLERERDQVDLSQMTDMEILRYRSEYLERLRHAPTPWNNLNLFYLQHEVERDARTYVIKREIEDSDHGSESEAEHLKRRRNAKLKRPATEIKYDGKKKKQHCDDEPMQELSGDEQSFDVKEPSRKRKRTVEIDEEILAVLQEAEMLPGKQRSDVSAPKSQKSRGGIPIRDPRPFYPCWGGPQPSFEPGGIHYIPEEQWPESTLKGTKRLLNVPICSF